MVGEPAQLSEVTRGLNAMASRLAERFWPGEDPVGQRITVIAHQVVRGERREHAHADEERGEGVRVEEPLEVLQPVGDIVLQIELMVADAARWALARLT